MAPLFQLYQHDSTVLTLRSRLNIHISQSHLSQEFFKNSEGIKILEEFQAEKADGIHSETFWNSYTIKNVPSALSLLHFTAFHIFKLFL